MVSGRQSQRGFLGIAALLFVGSAAVTIAGCASMSAMGGMPMPGGWTLSMLWLPMAGLATCGASWSGAAVSFLGMWVAMMAAMMLPSLVPMLQLYRQAVGETGGTRLSRLTALVGACYFLVWTLNGIAVLAVGAVVAAATMHLPALARAVPSAVGAVVLLGGALQFTAWKAHHLACCRATPDRCHMLPPSSAAAWRHGLSLGLHCSKCSAGLTAILLALGVMDLRAMIVVAAAITAERLAPDGARIARAIGAVAVTAGMLLIWRGVALV